MAIVLAATAEPFPSAPERDTVAGWRAYWNLSESIASEQNVGDSQPPKTTTVSP
jgi:hypothetical protein